MGLAASAAQAVPVMGSPKAGQWRVSSAAKIFVSTRSVVVAG
jgi:hypothetical protein